MFRVGAVAATVFLLSTVARGDEPVVRQTASSRGTTKTINSVEDRRTVKAAEPAAINRYSAAQAIVGSSFKAGPFQDPATGLVFVRDRWYDRGSGTFLTPDPEKFRDSSNLYLFTGGDPILLSDPTGRYQADFHYGLTFFLAERAGFCRDIAAKIAAGTELPDQDPGRDPLTQGKIMKSPFRSGPEKEIAQNMLWVWHFPKPMRNAGKVVPGSPAARALAEQGLQSGRLSLLAQGLHPLQDSWSHRGIPSLDGVAGHPDERGGTLSTKTDVPWHWPDQALAAAEATYRYLVAYRQKYPLYGGGCTHAPYSWGIVAAEAGDFIRLKKKSEKRAWLAARGITMPPHYWDDVSE